MATFVSVVETGSFTRAAMALSLPKARVSQRVSDLETHLGIRLLHRTTRALSLTNDGQAYFNRCKELLHEIEELESALRDDTAKPRGRLKVEALVSIARYALAPRLHEFKKTYPNLSIRLGSNDRITNLLEDGIDVAIRGGPLDDSSLIARHICDVRFGLYATGQYLADQGSIEHPEELKRHQLISWFNDKRNPFSWQLQQAGNVLDISADVGFHFDDPDVAISCCLSGSGVCPASPFAVARLVATGELVPVLPAWSFPARPIHIIYPSNKQLSSRVRAFVEWSMHLMKNDENISMSPLELAQKFNLD